MWSTASSAKTTRATALMRAADDALHRAKLSGGNRDADSAVST